MLGLMLGGLEDVGVDAVRTIYGGTVIGAVTVLLLILIIWREVFYWPRLINKQEDEIDRCHAAHEITRTALLAEVRTGGETLVLVKEQMKAMETHRASVEAMMRVISDRLPEFRGRP